MNIYISGSLAYDRIMSFPDRFSNHILPDKLHILNVCFLVNDLSEKFGGTAGNIAYSLGLLEESPVVLATAGSDFERYRQWLEQRNVDLQGVKVVTDQPCASAYITTDQADNQITAFNPGAMNIPTNGEYRSLIQKEGLGIVSPGNLEDMEQYPRIYRELDMPYIFDPGQNIPAFSGEQLKTMIQGSFMLIANDYELSLIMESTGLDTKGLLDLTQTIVTTLGEEGSLIQQKDQKWRVPALKVQHPLDPTGCGDAFRSGLLKGLSEKRDLAEAARMGATCASFCVEHNGTQEHVFTLPEFWQRHEGG
ncbi:MAG: carbohydrate kinase family protein [Desulfohalobiaceae bacterium]|nr:carbohydrate kinase family protein [Desulfohalobiaceae bacterium]